jgi:hypothetical protein
MAELVDGVLDASGIGTYGTIAAAEQQAEVLNNPKEWHNLGNPMTLMFKAATRGAKPSCFLCIILASVFLNREYLMRCDERTQPILSASFCEYTKAYVRSFPLIALIVAILMSCRQILHHRMYYEFMKRGVLIDFERYSPLADPLFPILLWCAINAIAHFALSFVKEHNESLNHAVIDQRMMKAIQKLAAFYVVPTGLFIMFLYNGYDTNSSLLPLNKYFGGDPDEARRLLGRMRYITEGATAAATENLSPSEDLDEAIRQVTFGAEVLMKESKTKADAIPPMSQWRLICGLWPARFLMHSSRNDEESQEFRRVWNVMSVFSLLVISSIIAFFLRQFYLKIWNVIYKEEYSDVAGLVVALGHSILAAMLAYPLIRTITRS